MPLDKLLKRRVVAYASATNIEDRLSIMRDLLLLGCAALLALPHKLIVADDVGQQ